MLIYLDFVYISSVVKTSLWVREVWDSRPRPVKSDAVSPSSCHRCNISSDFEAVLRRRLHASAYYREYNEDLIFFKYGTTQAKSKQ